MKRKLAALTLALCLVLGFAAPAGAAADAALETVLALGILQGDERGNLDLTAPVTRAQFATMMTRVSSYKDSIGAGPAYALFTDLPAGHWAAPYAETAVKAGWFIGYTDGSFRPDNTITLEEACTALLRLAGYDATTLSGPFPAAQLDKARVIGLRDGMTAQQGQPLTRSECVELFYNLLTVTTGRGQVFASTLGYTVSNGKVDYTALVRAETEGPFVAAGGDSLDFTPLKVLRNGKPVPALALRENQVYYYNDKIRTVWIYDNAVTGTVTALTPSANAPTSVTVDGTGYRLAGEGLGWQLSALNRDMKDQLVTLLLGMDNEVAGILTDGAVEASFAGSVLSVTERTEADGVVTTTLRMLCADGLTRSLPVDRELGLEEGELVRASVSGGETRVERLDRATLSGRITAEKIGDYTLAQDLKILDLSPEGTAGVTLELRRITGRSLRESDVLWYGLNELGELDTLILRDATGELWSYGLLTEVEEMNLGGQMSLNVIYRGFVNGRETSQFTSNIRYGVAEGGFALRYEGTEVADMKKLAPVKLDSIGASAGYSGSRSYALAPELQFYLLSDGQYYAIDRETVLKNDWPMTGWQDSAPLGGLVRVIVAEK